MADKLFPCPLHAEFLFNSSEMTVRELLEFCSHKGYHFTYHWLVKRAKELKAETNPPEIPEADQHAHPSGTGQTPQEAEAPRTT